MTCCRPVDFARKLNFGSALTDYPAFELPVNAVRAQRTKGLWRHVRIARLPPMQISGNTRVFLILGDPVQQVRAPLIFNRLFELQGLDAVLVPVQVPASEAKNFMGCVMRSTGVAGLWLTIPHKTSAMSLLAHTDRLAQLSGAVNAVRRGIDGGLEGALFDGLGFVRSLDHHRVSVAGRSALVVGAGGAGLAIGTALADRGVALLNMADLDLHRAQAAAASIQREFGIEAAAVTQPMLQHYDLIVNATPAGLDQSDALPFDVDALDSSTVVVDILMPTGSTPLLDACRKRGIHAISGHEMLVQQVPDYLRFFGFAEAAEAVGQNLGLVRELISSH